MIGEDYFIMNDFLYEHGISLSLLARELYDKYKYRYWRENIFVSTWCEDGWIHKIRLTRYSRLRESDFPRITLTSCTNCQKKDHDLRHIWTRKATILFMLKLDRLILDVRDAYSSNDEFLGLQFAWSAPRFEHGIPRYFEVIAPSKLLERAIRRIIEDINR